MATSVIYQTPAISLSMPSNTTTTNISAGLHTTAETPTPPELSDLDYFITVLQLPGDRTENQIEDQLVSKANSLGISTAPAADKRITSSVESASTAHHGRTFSIMSSGSTSTALTAHSSLFGPSMPEPRLSSSRPSKDLNFAQYDRYLSIIDPQHNHHKFLKDTPPPSPTARSILSGKTKRNLFKSGLKLRWRRKPTPQPFEVIEYVTVRFPVCAVSQRSVMLTWML